MRFENTYRRFDDADLVHMMDNTEDWMYQGKPHEYEEGNIGCHQYQRKFDADYTHELSRSVRAALANWKPEN